MNNRSILRLPEPEPTTRLKRRKAFLPSPTGPGRQTQRRRFQSTFDRLTSALQQSDPVTALRKDPNGIAPERALVFVTAGSIDRFVHVARLNGFEVLAETTLESTRDYPEGFAPPEGDDEISRSLYATMPTIESLNNLEALWKRYSRREQPPDNASVWWSMFEMMLELRTWGPEDRLSEDAREVIRNRLPFDENEEVSLELELWPETSLQKRAEWHRNAQRWVTECGGRVISRASISELGFAYDGMLTRIPTGFVREMLDNPGNYLGLATLEGVQFVLPQTIAQTSPTETEIGTTFELPASRFDEQAPVRAALFDSTPTAAHQGLDGGIIIEDLNDLVRLSVTNQRFHATGMASLVLRGDLRTDGEPLRSTRIVSVPILIDDDEHTRSPEDRLFVDLVHSSLTRLFREDASLSRDIFVVNFSVAIHELHFGGRMSSLSRLMDWWAATEGVLFVVSAGNVGELVLEGINWSDFEALEPEERRNLVDEALRNARFNRSLLSPAECVNGLCVGALSKDSVSTSPLPVAGIVSLEDEHESLPQITSALGLGPHRAIKPDVLARGGKMEVRVIPDGQRIRLQPVAGIERTGLVAAAPSGNRSAIQQLRGTSVATALTTRAILQSAESLLGEGGPFEGQDLSRRTTSLLTRALAVNAARWPESAWRFNKDEVRRLGSPARHVRAKEEVCRHFGYGVIDVELMLQSPGRGATLVGYGTVRKDEAQVFNLPLPDSLSGARLARSMRVTVAWFSPVDPVRARYRLAGLEVVPLNENSNSKESGWGLNLKTSGPDTNMVKHGTVWSSRLTHRTLHVPSFDEYESLHLCVQCRDASQGGLSPDADIPFALAVSLEIESDILYDIYYEIEAKLGIRERTVV